MSKIKTNNAGFVNFKNRNFGFKGDRGTWAKFDGKKLTVCIAKSGTISSDYTDELKSFCEEYEIDWDAMSCGDKIEKDIL